MSSSNVSTNEPGRASVLDATTTTDASKNPNLPPPRTEKGLRDDVSPPFSRVRMDTFVYSLTIGALLLALFFSVRMTEWKTQQGGVLNLLMGRHPDAPAPAAADIQD